MNFVFTSLTLPNVYYIIYGLGKTWNGNSCDIHWTNPPPPYFHKSQSDSVTVVLLTYSPSCQSLQVLHCHNGHLDSSLIIVLFAWTVSLGCQVCLGGFACRQYVFGWQAVQSLVRKNLHKQFFSLFRIKHWLLSAYHIKSQWRLWLQHTKTRISSSFLFFFFARLSKDSGRCTSLLF